MPRRLHRYYGSGYAHFITSSCYHQRPLLGTAVRRNLFVKILEEVRLRYHFVVIGYVVMPEHIHLLISEPDRGTPSTVMQVLKQRFARRVLSELRRKDRPGQSRLWQESLDAGHVWQHRFYDFVVHTEKKRVEKLEIHASQSGEAGVGAGTGSVGLEQFSVVCSRRARTGAGERTASGGDKEA